MSDQRLDALVLAAGRSTRMGVNKILLPAGPGRTVLTRAVSVALRVVDGRVVVVSGRDPDRVRWDLVRRFPHLLDTDRLRLFHNSRYQTGLSSSLDRGLAPLDGDTRGVLVLLADQPGVEPGRLRRLRERYTGSTSWATAASLRGNTPRNPVVVGPELVGEFRRVEGDRGGKPVLERHRNRLDLVPWGEGVWFRDVDTWDQYRALARHFGWDEDPTALTPSLQGERDRSLLEAFMREVLSLRPVPWLTEESLVEGVAENSRFGRLVARRSGPLRVPMDRDLGPERTVRTLFVGRDRGPGEYLALLRCAAVWALCHG